MKCKTCEWATIVERYPEEKEEHIKVVCPWQVCRKRGDVNGQNVR